MAVLHYRVPNLPRMHAIGLPSVAFLFYLLVFMPFMAIRSKRRMLPPPAADGSPGRPIPSRAQMLSSTLVSLALLFYISRITAGSFDYAIFTVPHLGVREGFAGFSAVAFCIALARVNRAMRSPVERRTMPVYKLLPRTPAEWGLYVVVALGAGVAEEAAYRGVLVQILWYALGSPWPAVLISAAAFAVAHALQGWKSGVMIFVIALVMQALVWFTGTLVVAMAGHATYDLAAGYIGARRIAKGEVDG